MNKNWIVPCKFYESYIYGIVNILESCRLINNKITIYNNGLNKNKIFKKNVKSGFSKINYYDLTKLISSEIIKSYREMYGLKVYEKNLYVK